MSKKSCIAKRSKIPAINNYILLNNDVKYIFSVGVWSVTKDSFNYSSDRLKDIDLFDVL